MRYSGLNCEASFLLNRASKNASTLCVDTEWMSCAAHENSCKVKASNILRGILTSVLT
jgi:hypothetical protein